MARTFFPASERPFAANWDSTTELASADSSWTKYRRRRKLLCLDVDRPNLQDASHQICRKKGKIYATAAAEEPQRLGILTEQIRTVFYTPSIQGYGIVSGFDALAQAESDLATAEAAARQSEASYVRTRRMATLRATTREALDLAAKQAATNKAQVMLARRKEAVASAVLGALASHLRFETGIPTRSSTKTVNRFDIQRNAKFPTL